MAGADTKPPLETFAIRVAPVEAPDEVWRVVEMRGNQKLRDLYATIADELGLDPEAPWRVFLTNRPFDRAGEYAYDARARQATLAQLGLARGQPFLLLAHETTERWCRGELVATGTADRNTKYPRVTERHGEPPDPFADIERLFANSPLALGDEDEEDTEDEGEDETDDAGHDGAGPAHDDEIDADAEPTPTDEDRALFDRALTAAREYDAHFEREDSANAPRERAKVVERDLPLAREMCARFGPRLEIFDALLDEADDASVAEWLDMLPFDLEDHGLRDEAIALCDELSALLDPAETASSRAVLLERAGRKDEAVAASEAMLSRYPDNMNVRAQAVTVLHKAGQRERAEELARAILAADLEDEDVLHYQTAIEVLTDVLRATGRDAEADALAHSEQAERAAAYGGSAGEFGGGLEGDDDDDDDEQAGELDPGGPLTDLDSLIGSLRDLHDGGRGASPTGRGKPRNK